MSINIFESIILCIGAIFVIMMLLVIALTWPPRRKKKPQARSRVIISWTGPVKVKTPGLGECTDACTEHVLIGDERIIWGISSIFERYAEQNRIIQLTVEDVTDLVED